MVPKPTQILRFVHVDNLPTLIRRGGLHAPNTTPNDGRPYLTIFGHSEQAARAAIAIPCGSGGTLHDYVPFYFGPLSPMMFRLKTGRVEGYADGQERLVYCVSNAQAVAKAGLPFVFSDGHGLARLTAWFDDLAQLGSIDWDMVNERYWSDTLDDSDRQRRKQAESLIREACPWAVITEIVVIDEGMKARVESVFDTFPASERKPVSVRRDWYYH